MAERTQTTDETETRDTDEYIVDETPEFAASEQQEYDHRPNEYTTGYDSFGDTRVGIGSAGGDATKLVRHNEGRHQSDGNHSAREAARDKKRITQSFCSKIGVTPYQQREAVTAIGSLNLDRFGRQKRLEKVALGTIKVIVEWDRFHKYEQDVDLATLSEGDMPDRMLENREYCNLIDEFEVSRKDLFSVSQLVKRELKKQNHFRPTTDQTADLNADETSGTLHDE